MAFQFQKATRSEAKARVAIAGPAGSGKTYTALMCAKVLAGPNGRIGVIDTERGSASLYADKFSFDAGELTPEVGYAPRNFVAAIEAAEKAGYDVIVLDSMSHEWEGAGGALEMVDDAAQRLRGNSYAAWKDVTPEHRKLIDKILQCKCHIIVTMRSKMEYLQKEENGRKVIEKVGMAPIQRQGTEYEFTIFCDMDVNHTLMVTKSRCDVLADKRVQKPDEAFFQILKDWLDSAQPAPEKLKQSIEAPKTLDMLIAEGRQYNLDNKAAVMAYLKEAGFAKFEPARYDEYVTAFQKRTLPTE